MHSIADFEHYTKLFPLIRVADTDGFFLLLNYAFSADVLFVTIRCCVCVAFLRRPVVVE